jgi:hypothetical protein
MSMIWRHHGQRAVEVASFQHLLQSNELVRLPLAPSNSDCCMIMISISIDSRRNFRKMDALWCEDGSFCIVQRPQQGMINPSRAWSRVTINRAPEATTTHARTAIGGNPRMPAQNRPDLAMNRCTGILVWHHIASPQTRGRSWRERMDTWRARSSHSKRCEEARPAGEGPTADWQKVAWAGHPSVEPASAPVEIARCNAGNDARAGLHWRECNTNSCQRPTDGNEAGAGAEPRQSRCHRTRGPTALRSGWASLARGTGTADREQQKSPRGPGCTRLNAACSPLPKPRRRVARAMNIT